MEIKDIYNREKKVTEVGYNGKRFHRELTTTRYENTHNGIVSGSNIFLSIIWYYGNPSKENIEYSFDDNKWFDNKGVEIDKPDIEIEYMNKKSLEYGKSHGVICKEHTKCGQVYKNNDDGFLSSIFSILSFKELKDEDGTKHCETCNGEC